MVLGVAGVGLGGGDKETLARLFELDVDATAVAVSVGGAASLLTEPVRSTKGGTSSIDEAEGPVAATVRVDIVSTGSAINRRAPTSSVQPFRFVGRRANVTFCLDGT